MRRVLKTFALLLGLLVVVGIAGLSYLSYSASQTDQAIRACLAKPTDGALACISTRVDPSSIDYTSWLEARARVLLEKGDHAGAIRDLTEKLDTYHEDYSDLRVMRAKSYIATLKADLARTDLEAALKLDDDGGAHAEARRLLAQLP